MYLLLEQWKNKKFGKIIHQIGICFQYNHPHLHYLMKASYFHFQMFFIYFKMWNREAAKNAEKWAKKCTLTHSSSSKRKISCKSSFSSE